MVGDLEREVQINIDMFKMQAANFSLYDIFSAVSKENMNMSGGLVPMDGMKRNLSIKGEFTDVDQIRNLIVTSGSGVKVYLKDIADVVDGTKEQESYARLEGKNVITLNIVKRTGENLIQASDKINDLIKTMEKENFRCHSILWVTIFSLLFVASLLLKANVFFISLALDIALSYKIEITLSG